MPKKWYATIMAIADPSPASASLRPGQVLPAIAGIYVSQALLAAIIMQSLPNLLREAGASLQMVGFSALYALPWGLKFLWAPVVERWRLPVDRPQRRSRALLLAGQWLLAGLLGLLGLACLGQSPQTHTALALLLGALMVAALLAASIDIACDGFAVEQLASQQRGWGNVAQVGGSFLVASHTEKK